MKRRAVPVIVLVLLMAIGAVFAIRQLTRPKSASLEQELQSIVDSTAGPNKTIKNTVLYVTKGDGSFTWAGAAGIANQDAQLPMTSNTPIVIASVTKLFTATAVMVLYERGQLALSDPMAKYLPEDMINGIQVYQGHDYSNEITIEQLLAQTSGIPDYYDEKGKDGKTLFEILKSDQSQTWTVDQEIARARNDMTPSFKPGEKAFYSDTNYQLLGKIIEARTGKPLEVVFDEFFFRPLGLKHTWLTTLSQPEETPSVEVADVFSDDLLISQIRSSSAYWADGGIISTPEDCVLFLKALNQGRIIREDTLAKMHHWNPLSNPGMPFQYGYGTMKFEVPAILNWATKVPTVWGDSGSTGSFLYYSKDLDLYIAGTTNQVDDKIGPLMLMIKAMKNFQ